MKKIMLLPFAAALVVNLMLAPSGRANGPTVEPGPETKLGADMVGLASAMGQNADQVKELMGLGNTLTSVSIQAIAPGRYLYRLTVEQCQTGFAFICMGGAVLTIESTTTYTVNRLPTTTFKTDLTRLR